MTSKYNRTSNPQYDAMFNTWLKMWDVFQGEEHIKNRARDQNSGNLDGQPQLKALSTFEQYLRPTDSMRRLGDMGYQRFCDYIYRAKFYAFPSEVQQQSLGLIENQPATFELPSAMEGMIQDATTNNESLEKLLSVTYERQLQSSRVGLLLSPSNEPNKPFNIGAYRAEAIVDWVEMVDENSELYLVWVKLLTGEVDDNNKPIYLILGLDDGGNYIQYETTWDSAHYGDNGVLEDGYIADTLVMPLAGETSIQQIPFVIVNYSTLGGNVERPFLETIADSSVSLFRASAHYEDALYWGGESTLFSKGYGLGNEKTVYVGNGASNKTNLEYADAKYVTMGVDGIGPREENVQKQYDYCISLSVDLLNKGTESGSALSIRTNVKTASLKTLSLTGALGLQAALKIGAVWLGLDADAVKVEANTTFADDKYTAEDFLKLSGMMNLKTLRPEDMYVLQKKNNVTVAESFEDWESTLDFQVDDNLSQE